MGAKGAADKPLAAQPSNGSEVSPRSAKRKLHRGVKVAMAATFIFTTGTTALIPFLQSRRDELGCDALCQGTMMSMRSMLQLVGASLFGRMSDCVGRLPILWVSVVGTLAAFAANAGMDNLAGLWYATAIGAFFNQNFGITKALFSDYIEESPSTTDADKADVVGKLGMIVGFALLAGPAITGFLGFTYMQALGLCAVLVSASGAGLLALPSPRKASSSAKEASGSPLKQLVDFVKLPVLQTRGAQAVVVLRFFMALAFNVYMPVLQASMRERFNFGPKDYAKQMGVIGLSYALSQGVIAKPLVKACGADSTRLVLGCVFLLGALRVPHLFTSSIYIMYALYVVMVIALGVVNTVITTTVYRLADAGQVGGFLGMLESVESLGGIVGPTIGGLLTRLPIKHATLAGVLVLYSAAFCTVFLFFSRHVFQAGSDSSTASVEGKKDR